MERLTADLAAAFPGMPVKGEEPLAAHTTLGVGGPCGAFVTPRGAEEFRLVRAFLLGRGVPSLPLGGGSNVLAADEGYRGAVLSTEGLDFLEVRGTRIRAGAGVRLPVLAATAREAGLSGAEFFAGIPGTVGGAVRGNAGAFGGTTAEILERAEVLEGGEVRLVGAAECGFGERSSAVRGIVLSAVFRLAPGDRRAIDGETEQQRAYRAATQPRGRSAGSTFRSADGVPAGLLLDRAGLKGLTLGGARISEKHANFILNTGGATAADVRRLMETARLAVFGAAGVRLTAEIVRFGDGI